MYGTIPIHFPVHTPLPPSSTGPFVPHPHMPDASIALHGAHHGAAAAATSNANAAPGMFTAHANGGCHQRHDIYGNPLPGVECPIPSW